MEHYMIALSSVKQRKLCSRYQSKNCLIQVIIYSFYWSKKNVTYYCYTVSSCEGQYICTWYYPFTLRFKSSLCVVDDFKPSKAGTVCWWILLGCVRGSGVDENWSIATLKRRGTGKQFPLFCGKKYSQCSCQPNNCTLLDFRSYQGFIFMSFMSTK